MRGLTSVGSIEEAYKTLEPLLGQAASWVFAISLLASGLSSSSVGTMAGQVIMQGFLKRHIPPWVRRLVTMGPPLIVIMLGLGPDPDAGDQPGVAQLWAAVCDHPAGDIYQQ